MELQETLDEATAALDAVPEIWREAAPGRQLRALRKSRRVSQRHLAEVSGVDQADISRMEHGADARLSTWKRLFSELGYDAVLLPLSSCEETAGLLQSQARERDERVERGWGNRRRW